MLCHHPLGRRGQCKSSPSLTPSRVGVPPSTRRLAFRDTPAHSSSPLPLVWCPKLDRKAPDAPLTSRRSLSAPPLHTMRSVEYLLQLSGFTRVVTGRSRWRSRHTRRACDPRHSRWHATCSGTFQIRRGQRPVHTSQYFRGSSTNHRLLAGDSNPNRTRRTAEPALED